MHRDFEQAQSGTLDADEMELQETIRNAIETLTVLSILVHNLHRDARQIPPDLSNAVPLPLRRTAEAIAEQKINAGQEFADPEQGLKLTSPTPSNCWPLCLPDALFQTFGLDEHGCPQDHESSILGEEDDDIYLVALRTEFVGSGLKQIVGFVEAATSHLNRALGLDPDTPAIAYVNVLADKEEQSLAVPIASWIVPHVELATRERQMRTSPLASTYILN